MANALTLGMAVLAHRNRYGIDFWEFGYDPTPYLVGIWAWSPSLRRTGKACQVLHQVLTSR